MRQSTLLLVGVNHNSLGFSRLERTALAKTSLPAVLEDLRARGRLNEAVALSTCSRLEVIAATDCIDYSATALRDWFNERAGTELGNSLYTHEGPDAISHLFRVAAGLDSWILGESEILRQVKDAYFTAAQAKSTGQILNRLLQKALATGKTVRAKTNLQNGIRSIGGATALLARRIFGAPDNGRVLVFGAGQTAEAVVRHLSAKNFRNICVANRTFNRAFEMAQRLGGQACSWEEGFSMLAEAEIAVFSTAAPKSFLNTSVLSPILRERKRPLFLIDLGLPRNVHPDCGQLPGVHLYDLGHLKEMIERSLDTKSDSLERAETLTRESAEKVWQELQRSATVNLHRNPDSQTSLRGKHMNEKAPNIATQEPVLC